jgi:hypothetical protein
MGPTLSWLGLGYEVAFDPLGRMATAAYGVVLPNLEPPTPFSIVVGPDGAGLLSGTVDGTQRRRDTLLHRSMTVRRTVPA